MSQNNILIELKSLSKRYGYGDTESYALRDFDITIRRGEFIMIMGPSGCGKTTLLDIIGLLDRATSGEYLLNGESIASISSHRQAKLRAKKIGFIFQNFNLVENLPVIENVALPLVYSGYNKTMRLKIASSVLERFNLKRREYYLPRQLSGGQQQHVAIARAIVSSPEIILADEPTGNLDSRASRNVMEVLKSIHQEGNTIIMVTHNPALTTYATRVIHMLDGHIDTDIKTVADVNLPQPIKVRFAKPGEQIMPTPSRIKKSKKSSPILSLPEPDSLADSTDSDQPNSITSENPKNPESSEYSESSKHLETPKSPQKPQNSQKPKESQTRKNSHKSKKSKSKRKK